jgi:hypothetical protein
MSIDRPAEAAKAAQPDEKPLAARLARFDRPALSIDELFRAQGRDFVHFACWTILARPPSREEISLWLNVLDDDEGKLHLVSILYRQVQSAAAVEVLPALRDLLDQRQRSSQSPLMRLWSSEVSQVLRGKAKAHGGRTRRLLTRQAIRVAHWLELPSSRKVKRFLRIHHAPPPSDFSLRATEIYGLLCGAIDRSAETR